MKKRCEMVEHRVPFFFERYTLLVHAMNPLPEFFIEDFVPVTAGLVMPIQ